MDTRKNTTRLCLGCFYRTTFSTMDTRKNTTRLCLGCFYRTTLSTMDTRKNTTRLCLGCFYRTTFSTMDTRKNTTRLCLGCFYRTTFSTMHTKKNTTYALVFSSCLPSTPAFFPKHSETRNKYDKSNNWRHSTDDQQIKSKCTQNNEETCR